MFYAVFGLHYGLNHFCASGRLCSSLSNSHLSTNFVSQVTFGAENMEKVGHRKIQTCGMPAFQDAQRGAAEPCRLAKLITRRRKPFPVRTTYSPALSGRAEDKIPHQTTQGQKLTKWRRTKRRRTGRRWAPSDTRQDPAAAGRRRGAPCLVILVPDKGIHGRS